MDRLVGILDDVCTRLADVQDVVSEHLGSGLPNQARSGQEQSSQETDQKSDQDSSQDFGQDSGGQYMERLQGLDALTQEVEAVRAVLARLSELAPGAGDGTYGLEAVLSGVRLSQIKAILMTGTPAKIGRDHGEFTLF